MRKTLALLTLLIAPAFMVRAATPDTAPAATTATAAATAQKFLATLDDSQRRAVVYDFGDNAQRARWSNLPNVRRGGLRMGDLTAPQRDAVMAMLAAALSPQGYRKVVDIVEGDQVLGNGRRPMFGRDQYYVSLLGQPSSSEPWMLQFGGHHLGLNITFAAGRGTVAPTHTGAEPAIYTLEGRTVRPLGREADKGFALFSALDATQRAQATLQYQVRDVVLGPGRDGAKIQPEGIKGTALTPQQRELLVDLASEWTGMLNEAQARAKQDELRRNIAETWFAWSGATESGRGYFRIQGPTVHIEYAPQSRDAAGHVHTIYRDPGNDYGAQWWSR